MCKIAQRIGIGVLAFVVGVTAFWAAGLTTKANILLAKVAPGVVFTENGRACGCGYANDYSILGGGYLSEGAMSAHSCGNLQEYLDGIMEHTAQIVERIPATNRYGSPVERITLITTEGRAMILWHNQDTINYIEAPNIEIAHGFDKADAYRK